MKRAKKEPVEEPYAVKVKLDEMKSAHNELHEQTKAAQMKELIQSQEKVINLAHQTWRSLSKAARYPLSVWINRPHSRGDYYGKFHPSKSNKGIKRSAQ